MIHVPARRRPGLGQDWQLNSDCQLVDCSQWASMGNGVCWNILGIPGMFGIGVCNESNAAAVQDRSNLKAAESWMPIALLGGGALLLLFLAAK